MSFNLRGGRPKSKRNGIYWVQQHLADRKSARAQAVAVARKSEAEAAKQERQKATADAAFQRYERLSQNVIKFFEGGPELTVSAGGKTRMALAQARWEAAKDVIVEDSLSQSIRNIGKFATAGRNFIVTFAKLSGQAVEWDSTTGKLTIDGHQFDFS